MTTPSADLQTVVARLNGLEDDIHQLRTWVAAQLAGTTDEAPTDHPHIARAEGVLGGEPIIRGTRTPVRAIIEYWKLGVPPEEIVQKLPHLRLAQVFAALSYYDDHRDEIENYLALNRVPVDD